MLVHTPAPILFSLGFQNTDFSVVTSFPFDENRLGTAKIFLGFGSTFCLSCIVLSMIYCIIAVFGLLQEISFELVRPRCIL